MKRHPSNQVPVIVVVSVRSGIVEEVRANLPLHVLVEDWDGTEVRPSHDVIVPELFTRAEEAHLVEFFDLNSRKGE